MTQDTEQYRAGFEAWFEEWRVSTWHPLPSDISNGKAECPKHWNTNAKHHMEIAWAASKREASTEPSAIRGAALEEAIAICKKARAWQCVDGIRALKNYGGAGALPDEAKDAARYAWLRGQGATFYTDDEKRHHVCESAMDTAIDAAIEAHTNDGKEAQ